MVVEQAVGRPSLRGRRTGVSRPHFPTRGVQTQERRPSGSSVPPGSCSTTPGAGHRPARSCGALACGAWGCSTARPRLRAPYSPWPSRSAVPPRMHRAKRGTGDVGGTTKNWCRTTTGEVVRHLKRTETGEAQFARPIVACAFTLSTVSASSASPRRPTGDHSADGSSPCVGAPGSSANSSLLLWVALAITTAT